MLHNFIGKFTFHDVNSWKNEKNCSGSQVVTCDGRSDAGEEKIAGDTQLECHSHTLDKSHAWDGNPRDKWWRKRGWDKA